MNAELPDAEQRILDAVARVPRGRVASYGQIAALAGLPRRARLVGRVLRHADDPALPWHRVLRADGAIAFPQGSAGFTRQRALLAREGVMVARGRVDLRRFGWQHDLDAALWGPDALAPAPPPRAARARMPRR